MRENGFSKRGFLKLGGLSLAAAWTGRQVFATPSKTPFSPVRFAVVSDPHLDIRGTNGMKMGALSAECLERTVADLNQEKDLAFVFVPGDLLQDGELENARVAKKILEGLSAPCFVISGNHDYAPADPAKRRDGFTYLTSNEFVRFFQGHGYEADGKHYHAHPIVPGLRVIGLDACQPGVKGTFGGILPKEQMEWLDRQLADHADELNLVFVHHNLIRWSEDELPGGPKAGFAIENEPEVRALLSKHAQAAPVVVSGHRHIGLHCKQDGGVNYFVVPSLNSHPMRYNLFSLSNRSIAWKTPMVRLPETVHLQARENLLDATFWRATQYAQRTPANDAAVLRLYENNPQILGSAKFQES